METAVLIPRLQNLQAYGIQICNSEALEILSFEMAHVKIQ